MNQSLTIFNFQQNTKQDELNFVEDKTTPHFSDDEGNYLNLFLQFSSFWVITRRLV
jgi:hypothetical protein